MVNGVALDAEQMANATTIASVTAGRSLPSYAAVVAVDVAFTESSLRNTTTQSDHDSEGLFQQRISIYSKAVADDPVQATGAFLDRLMHVSGWQHKPVDVDAQAVQISQHPERYTSNTALAQQLVGRLWPAAAAAIPRPSASTRGLTPLPTKGSTSSTAVVCPGGDGAIPLTGGHGNKVAGTTAIPPGLRLTGSTKGNAATQFALAQLGKSYVFAAAGPDSYDCSGLTLAAWATQGIALVHLAATQATQGTPEPINLSQAVSGDLVLIPGADGTAAAPGHVGMIVGETSATKNGKPARDLWLIQAPGYADLPVELTEATEWSSQIVAVRHIA
jgi:cell wall-associated NlpC family hydrolase